MIMKKHLWLQKVNGPLLMFGIHDDEDAFKSSQIEILLLERNSKATGYTRDAS